MKYSVTAKPVVGYDVRSKSATSENEAIELAKKWAHEFAGTENGVYIEFFRESDGQHGYINPDGHGISGKDWTSSVK